MSGTVKTVLIVGGAGVGVFVLLKLLSPPPLVRAYGQPSSSAGTLQGLIGLGSSIGKLFGSSGGRDTTGNAVGDISGQIDTSGVSPVGSGASYDLVGAYTDSNGKFQIG